MRKYYILNNYQINQVMETPGGSGNRVIGNANAYCEYYKRSMPNTRRFQSAASFSPEHSPQINAINASRAVSQSEALFTLTF
jgi:hypothetical protein